MRAAQVLQRCLSDALVPMHTRRREVLFKATEGLLQGRRLTLMDVARSWPDAQRVRAPLKALDRLLSTRHLQGERLSLHAAMAVWLLRHPQPVIERNRGQSALFLQRQYPYGTERFRAA